MDSGSDGESGPKKYVAAANMRFCKSLSPYNQDSKKTFSFANVGLNRAELPNVAGGLMNVKSNKPGESVGYLEINKNGMGDDPLSPCNSVLRHTLGDKNVLGKKSLLIESGLSKHSLGREALSASG